MVSVANIHITGDSATADVTYKGAKVPDKPWNVAEKFTKEDSKWKECTPPDDNQNDGGSGN